MKPKELPLSEQKSILERILKQDNDIDLDAGLCVCICRIIIEYYGSESVSFPNDASIYIPVLSRENAYKISNETGRAYWFKNNDERVLFLKWAISELNSKIENE